MLGEGRPRGRESLNYFRCPLSSSLITQEEEEEEEDGNRIDMASL